MTASSSISAPENKWSTYIGGFFCIASSLALGFIECSAMLTTFPAIGLAWAIVFGIASAIVEGLAYWQNIIKSVDIIFMSDNHKSQKAEYRPSRMWLNTILLIAFMVGLGFAAITYTHCLTILTTMGVSITITTVVASVLCIFALAGYGLFFHFNLYEHIQRGVDKTWQEFKDYFQPSAEDQDSTINYIATLALKITSLLLILFIAFFTILLGAGTWFDSAIEFFSSDLLGYIIIGVFVIPVNLLTAIQYSIGSIRDISNIIIPPKNAVDQNEEPLTPKKAFAWSLVMTMLLLHVWADGAVPGEDTRSPFTECVTTLIGAIYEFLADFHLVSDMLDYLTHTHAAKHEHHELAQEFDPDSDDELGHDHKALLGVAETLYDYTTHSLSSACSFFFCSDAPASNLVIEGNSKQAPQQFISESRDQVLMAPHIYLQNN